MDNIAIRSCRTCCGEGSVRMFNGTEHDADGNEIEIDVGASMICPDCDGRGTKEVVECLECGGTGTLPLDCPSCSGESEVNEDIECDECDNKGFILVTCSQCSGEGTF